jgi:hypothetical protein
MTKAYTGTNPGEAGPKGALELPDAKNKKSGRNEDKNVQASFVKLSKSARKKSHREGSN